MTESILVETMAQSFWLRKRALYLQDRCATDEDLTLEEQQKQLGLFLRYQTTNDRAFHKCLNQLLKLRAERRKAEIGFESQQQKKAQESRREAAEKRKQDLHRWAVLLAEAKVNHQQVLTLNAEMDRTQATIAQNEQLEARTSA